MARIIALVNHKGGVGKTTTTLNLGKALSLQNQKVLIIDIDPQANLSQSVGIDEPKLSVYHTLCDENVLYIQEIAKNFDISPAELQLSSAEMKLQAEHIKGYFKLKKAIELIQSQYDYILIDCPPSLGVLTINALTACNSLIIVMEPQYLSIKGLETIMDLYENIKETINFELKICGFLFTRYNKTVVSKSIIEQINQQYPSKVFKTIIRQNVAINEASINRKDIFTYDSTSIGAEDYTKLSKEIING